MQKKVLPPSIRIDCEGNLQVIRPLCITTSDASLYLESRGYPVKASTLEVWRCQSKGPKYRKIGRRVFYTQQDLDEFLEGIQVQTIDPAKQNIRPRRMAG